jgi:hypothetical protein
MISIYNIIDNRSGTVVAYVQQDIMNGIMVLMNDHRLNSALPTGNAFVPKSGLRAKFRMAVVTSRMYSATRGLVLTAPLKPHSNGPRSMALARSMRHALPASWVGPVSRSLAPFRKAPLP